MQQQGPVFVQRPLFGNEPQPITCPNCQVSGISEVKHEIGVFTWLLAGGICVVG
jgi:hypothetical protein